jgi:hypothetical protein
MPMMPEYERYIHIDPAYPPKTLDDIDFSDREGEHPLQYASRVIGEMYQVDPVLASKTSSDVLDKLSSMLDRQIEAWSPKEKEEDNMKWFKKKEQKTVVEQVSDEIPLGEQNGVPEYKSFDPTTMITDPKIRLMVEAIKLAWKERTHIFSIGKKIKKFCNNKLHIVDQMIIAMFFIMVAIAVVTTLWIKAQHG